MVPRQDQLCASIAAWATTSDTAGPTGALRATFYGLDRERWTKALREADRELGAARTLTAVNAAAKKLQRAKAELKALEDVPGSCSP